MEFKDLEEEPRKSLTIKNNLYVSLCRKKKQSIDKPP